MEQVRSTATAVEAKAPESWTYSQSVGEWSVPVLFQQQAERRPGKIAVEFELESLSFADLNQRANRLAHHLIERGIGPEDIVGLALPRSLDLVVAFLGILKSGAAYLPLDSSYPAQRVAFMLDDARPRLVLTCSAVAQQLPPISPSLCLDDPDVVLGFADQSDTNPSDHERIAPLIPGHPAYVIYTSGSTGLPKGVVVTHEGIANLVTNQMERFAITAASRVLQFASVSFDAAVSEICTSLVAGARLVLAPASRLMPGEALGTLIAHSGATHATLPPSALAVMPADSLPSGFTLVVAGEACPPHLVERWSPGRRLINAYGPTEATVCATMTDPLSGSITPPLGRPLSNVEVFVLDDDFKPVPVGVAGDLYIAGVGLARGYLRRPDLTAERFLPNPFGPAGSRMYFTGDIACWREKGVLDFLGRADHQVKIRGYRVEPGEVEGVLARHVAVVAVAVVARTDGEGQQQLVGYVVLGPDESIKPAALRQYVAEYLPDYLVPAAIVLLETLPLTLNGKLDRDALPEPRFTANRSTPKSPHEAALARLFAEVLSLDEFGMEDSFFDLGGHSLGATRLISRIRATFGVMLELDDVFDTPTVAGLAARFAAAEPSKPVLHDIVRVPRHAHMPLSFSQQRLWFLDQLEPGCAFYNMPGAASLLGPLNVDVLRRALNEIIRRHEALRATFSVIDDVPVQIIAEDVVIELPLSDLTLLPRAQRAAVASVLIDDEKGKPFDLSIGPLIRARLICREDDEHTLLVTVHHTVADGWSMGLLFNEVASLYGAFFEQLPSPLPEFAIQYADYAHWQRLRLSGDVLQQQLSYWKQQLADSPVLLALPTDLPRPAVQSFHGSAHVRTWLPSALTAPLQQLASECNSTLFMAMLTVLEAVLLRWTGQVDMVVGTVVAGRTHTAIEPLIGCFINFLPLRTRCTPQDSTLDLMKRLTRTVREAYAHQDVPFDKMTEAVNPKRDSGHNPIFNVGFLLQNFPDIAFPGNQLTLKMLPVTQDTATLDLRFVAEESADGIHLACEYRTDLFHQETIVEVLNSYQVMLEACTEAPAVPLSDLPFSAVLESQRRAVLAAVTPAQHVAIAATFTAEPLRASLEFWSKELELPMTAEFVAYNQVLQTLLDPQGVFANNRAGANIILVRLEDWVRDAAAGTSPADLLLRVRQTAADFLAAVDASVERGGAPLVVCCCPLSGAARRIPKNREFFSTVQTDLLAELRSKPGVHAIGSEELCRLYPVAEMDDAHSDALGHIPYSADMYVAMATMLVRKLVALRRRPYKVIVLDCDNTLWDGVCGELGAEGVHVTAAHLALQRFMSAQSDAGMLLCIASKNNAADVDAVFAQNSGMLLKRNQFVASRINWQPKSQSIEELAAELQLSVDSFVFIDDNPVECAEVAANCPGVLVLRLPQRPECFTQFLDHVWAFDRAVVTVDAQRRTRQYLENKTRENLRASASSFAEFLSSLQLRVTLAPLERSQVERAAELTQRTNQFNLRPEPRLANDLGALRTGCLGVQVIDRFGDYGLTGLIVYEIRNAALVVDTFLLSCRVLGRGVEHQVIAQLAMIAEQSRCVALELTCTTTAKNEPLVSFLDSIGKVIGSPSTSTVHYAIPVSVARQLTPLQCAGASAWAKSPPILQTTNRREGAVYPADSALIQTIADNLNTPSGILQRLTESTRRINAAGLDYVAPQTTTEIDLATIWAKILNHDKVSIRDDFFALGGHSLLAAQVVSQIRTAFHIELSLRALFEAPTVEALAVVIDEAQILELGQYDETELQQMLAQMGSEGELSAAAEHETGLNRAN